MNRTLETRSEKAKATLKNHSFKIDQMTEYRTLKTITNTKIQPHFEEQQKTNVDKHTIKELSPQNIIPKISNLYNNIVLSMNDSIQEYYNMKMLLGLECA